MSLEQRTVCINPLCDRRTTAMYCCHPCDLAHAGRYEIHEDGLLGHSPGCNERHAEREEARRFIDGPHVEQVEP